MLTTATKIPKGNSTNNNNNNNNDGTTVKMKKKNWLRGKSALL